MALLHFLHHADGPFRKTVRPDGSVHPRLSDKWTSYKAPAENVNDFAAALETFSGDGLALLKGHLEQPIENEPYRNWLQLGIVNWMYLDFGAIPVGRHLQLPIDRATLADIAEDAIAKHWPRLSGVSCVVHASSRFGLDPSALHLHLFFLLDPPVDFGLLENLVMQAWLDSPTLQKHTRLGPGGGFCIPPLDQSGNDPSRLICITPPKFDGVTDPFERNHDRFAVLPGLPAYNAFADTDRVDYEDLQRARRSLLHHKRLQAGRSYPSPALRKIHIDGRPVMTVTRPDSVAVTIHDHSDPERIWLSLDGDHAEGWHIMRQSPRYVRNLKGHPVLSLTSVAPEFEAHLPELQSPAGQRTKPKIVCDFDDGTYWAFLHNASDDTWVESHGVRPIRRSLAPDFMRTHNHPGRDLGIAEGKIVYNPQERSRNVKMLENGTWVINSYLAPKLPEHPAPARKSPVSIEDTPALALRCGAIQKLLEHTLVNQDCYDQFFNWLACIWNDRSQAGTGWILPGVEDSGAGLLVRELIVPLFGASNVAIRHMNELADNDTAHLGQSLFTVIHGYTDTTRTRQPWWSIESLHSLARTETAFLQRPKSEPVATPVHTNFILIPNRPMAMKLPASDRRFNATPWRDEVFTERHPGISKNLRERVQKELPAFIAFLDAFEYEPADAASIVHSIGRTQLVAPGGERYDTFAKACLDVDMVFFEPLFLMDGRNTDTEEVMQAQRYMAHTVWDLHAGFLAILSMHQLCTIFHVLMQPPERIPLRTFNSAMYQRGIKRETRKSQRMGQKTMGLVLRHELATEASEVYAQHRSLIDRFNNEDTA